MSAFNETIEYIYLNKTKRTTSIVYFPVRKSTIGWVFVGFSLVSEESKNLKCVEQEGTVCRRHTTIGTLVVYSLADRVLHVLFWFNFFL